MKTHPSLGWCQSCGKQAFSGRKAAKAACRRRFPNERMQGYRCPVREGAWHAGHLADEVRSGEVSRAEFYGPRGVGRVREMQGTRRPLRRAVA